MGFERSDEMPRGMDSVYEWVDQFRFSRPMKNTARDFSDAVLLAEILAQLLPAWVQLHNYPSSHRFQQKLNNWETLNRKVLTRLKCGVSHKHQEDLANAVPGAIELLLIQVRKATANSPFLKAKHASMTREVGESTSPHSRSSSSTCSSQFTPSPRKQKQLPSALKLSSSALHADSHQQDSIATSFSKLLELMSDTADESGDAVHAKTRSRADTAPSFQLQSQTQAITPRPLTPNYAKPTLLNKAMSRPASVDAKSRLTQASPFTFKLKTDQVSKASLAVRSEVSPKADKKHLPSDTNEFQEGSFVYFQSPEVIPAAFSFGDPEDDAQVAHVIRALSSGECTLQLYRRVPSSDNPQMNPDNKTRCYSATPHFIDCCSTLLHTIPNMKFDPHTNTCEWHVRGKQVNRETQFRPIQSNVPPPSRHFYTEVLNRVTFTQAKLAAPLSKTTEHQFSAVCLPCPRFAESFRIPVQPTVFPKVRVDLVFELPDRFPRRHYLP